jgi:hypothetical protein
MNKSKNYWEVMKCGFGPYGAKTKANGVCPAAQENSLDGVHGGKYGGRACWFVDNTFGGKKGAQGDFIKKYPVCMNCKFYWQVREEEGYKFEINLLLNTYMRDK